MTPITIEPNSGVKMAGVKVRHLHWKSDPESYFEIKFVGQNRFFFWNSRDRKEDAAIIDSDWCLYEEPKPEVKWAPAAVRPKGGFWFSTYSLYKNFEDAKNHIAQECVVVWPARFDAEGYLIVPEEFK